MVVIVTIYTLTACSPNHESEQTTVKKETKTFSEKTFPSVEKNVTVKSIISQNPTQTNTAMNTVKTSIQWELSNGNKVTPVKNSFKWSATLGSDAIIALKVPNTTLEWYNYYVLENTNNIWGIKGIIDSPVEKAQLSKNKKGIEIPLNSFAASDLDIGKERKVWTFYNNDKAIMISCYPEEAISAVHYHMIKIKGRDAYVSSKKNRTSLFYFDEGKRIWIYGDMSKSQAIELAKSLPLTSSRYFPFRP